MSLEGRKPWQRPRPAAPCRPMLDFIHPGKRARPPIQKTNFGAVRSINPAGWVAARRQRGWHHQAEALQKHDRALGGSAPDELATFSLAILHINIPARILQAAILELAIHVDAIVQNYMLIFEHLILISIHRLTRPPCRHEEFNIARRRQHGRGRQRRAHPLGVR